MALKFRIVTLRIGGLNPCQPGLCATALLGAATPNSLDTASSSNAASKILMFAF